VGLHRDRSPKQLSAHRNSARLPDAFPKLVPRRVGRRRPRKRRAIAPRRARDDPHRSRPARRPRPKRRRPEPARSRESLQRLRCKERREREASLRHGAATGGKEIGYELDLWDAVSGCDYSILSTKY